MEYLVHLSRSCGSSSPSGSGTSRLPKPVSSTTGPASGGTATPMIAAARPSGCARTRGQHALGGVRAHADDRLAFVGDDERVDAEQLGRPRAPRPTPAARVSSTTMLTPLLAAISWSTPASPPRVGSFMATIVGAAGVQRRAHEPVDRRDVRRRSPSSISSWRTAITAKPWLANRPGDDDAVARPQPGVP